MRLQYLYIIYYLIIFISCIFHVLYNNQSRITCIWSWNYTHFQFHIYYNTSILCLYILIPADLFTRWGIDLFSPPDPFYRYFWSGGSIYSSPRTALGGTESQCHRKLTRSGNTLSVKA